MHKLLETYYNCIKSGASWGDALKFTLNKHERDYLEPMGISVESHQLAMRKMADYSNFWKQESIEIVGVEQPYSIVLYEDDDFRLINEGKIDLIIKLLSNGQQIVWDHKCGKAQEHPPLDNQVFSYALATDCRTFQYNVVGMGKTVEGSKAFKRQTVTIYKPNLDEWVRDQVYHAQRLLQNMADNYFPADFTGCVRRGKCPFLTVCIGPPDGREDNLKNKFRKADPHDLFAKEEEDD